MRINEIFYSPQGEGARAGEMSIFIRLAGCNLACGFCDTEFESGREMDDHQILAYIQERWPQCKWIVWTGGEPLLQLTESDVIGFKSKGYNQAIETNGSIKMPVSMQDKINHIVCSPKVADHVLKANFPNGVDELRYVRHAGQLACPEPPIAAAYYYLSPMFDGNKPNQENIAHCLALCRANPKWRLSLQLHKLIGVL